MSSSPIFFSTLRSPGTGIVPATADTSLTAPSNYTDIIAGVAAGTLITRIRIIQIASTTAAGLVNLFLHDGTNFRLMDQFAFSTLAISAIVSGQIKDFYYPDLILVGTSAKLRAAVSVSGGASAFAVEAHALDAT